MLTVDDGDTVTTLTVDAAGQDHTGATVAGRPNPQTGPFFVAGAEPGDTLAVDLLRMTPTRLVGWTGNVVAAHVIDPEDVRSLPARERILWDLDLEAGVARLQAPPKALERLAVPLDPMLGCFGVAPHGGQAISTATSGPFGGNMDYRGFRPGVTVYFPVFAPGALFHLGDGHAVQGDGEIVGNGIETSFEVEFRVRVIKGKEIEWPRGENNEFIFTVGNARPLDQCVQHATSEMLRWLAEDYHLDAVAASTVLGQCVRYDLGNIYDPAYTMVCKVPKVVLNSL